MAQASNSHHLFRSSVISKVYTFKFDLRIYFLVKFTYWRGLAARTAPFGGPCAYCLHELSRTRCGRRYLLTFTVFEADVLRVVD